MANQEQSDQLSRFWQEQITAWENSGQSQTTFCEQHELNYHRFGYWRRKFLGQSKPGLKSTSGFVPVRPVPGRTSSGLSLTLPSGVLIQGIEADNLALVRQLLQRL